MRLARAGRAAHAVAARAAAEEYDDVAGRGPLAHDVFLRCRGRDRAYLEALGDVAGVVELVDEAGGEAYLVAVGAVTRRRAGAELALRELVGKGVLKRDGGVARAGYAHGLVDVGPAGERVAYRAAYAGGRAAEGLYLRRVVVRLVLEHQKPGLVLAVVVDRDMYGAGVYLLALVEEAEGALRLEVLRAYRREVHERHGPVLPAQLAADAQVVFIALAHLEVLNLDGVDYGSEGGVPAVVGPVGVEHPYLRHRGVAAHPGEVGAAELGVVGVHGEAHLRYQGLEPGAVERGEALYHGDVGRFGIVRGEALARGEARLARLDGVNHAVLYGPEALRAHLAVEQVDLGGEHARALAAADELDALGGGVRPLVELAGQVFDGEDGVGLRYLREHVVHLRLGEDHGQAFFEEPGVYPLYVVAVQYAHPPEPGRAGERGELGERALRLLVVGGALFNVNSVYHPQPSAAASALAPMSRR